MEEAIRACGQEWTMFFFVPGTSWVDIDDEKGSKLFSKVEGIWYAHSTNEGQEIKASVPCNGNIWYWLYLLVCSGQIGHATWRYDAQHDLTAGEFTNIAKGIKRLIARRS